MLLERGLTPEKMGSLSAGLNLWHLHQLATESFQEDVPISLDFLRNKKKEIIEKEGAGLIEFLETEHDLSFVSGHEFVKNRFKNASRAIKQNQLDVLPMGYLISGPIGTGKSFLVSAFAGEIGIPMVRLCNFYANGSGVTETNLERVLSILKAMTPVAVMIDEADTFLGSREDKRGDGSGSRIFAQIASFMGNTDYRGKIIWFLITSRPDLIPIDLKRQGRAEEHLALLPETIDEKIFETMQRKLDIKSKNFLYRKFFKKVSFEMSEQILKQYLYDLRWKLQWINVLLLQKDLEQTIKDFIPRYILMKLNSKILLPYWNVQAEKWFQKSIRIWTERNWLLK